MSQYVITGGNKLSGTVRISGNKNSILPCIAATLLTDEPVTLLNVPNITDVEVIKEIIKSIGALIEEGDHSLTITTPKITDYKLDDQLTNRLRGSMLLAGALLSRVNRVELSHPGGDLIGRRSVQTHLDGFESLGYKVEVDEIKYLIHQTQKVNEDVSYFLDEASLTATENLLLASVLRGGVATLKHCAIEPSVVDLCNLLVLMGARIEGIGTTTLKIDGVKQLHGATMTIASDFVEMGTYAVAAAITKGNLTIENCIGFDLEPIMFRLSSMGLNFDVKEDKVRVSCKELRAIPKIETNIWPGFPSDFMSPAIVLATQSRGVTLLHDWMYDGRFFFVDKLISMGAHITIADPHRVLVYGPTQLRARNLETPDIRAGMALVLAALVAKGTSTINGAELIERGYEDVVGTLSKLGADIQRID